VNGGARRDLSALEAALGYRFNRPELLEQALVHSSLSAEQSCSDNETLEFLGDAAIDLAVRELLMARYPDLDEGELSKARGAIVSATALSKVAISLNLGRWLMLGRGEENSGGRMKLRILAAAYEAIIGAVFLDGGYEACRGLIVEQFTEVLATAGRGVDHKTELQEISHRLFKKPPTYRLAEITGPDHERAYSVEVEIGGRVLGRGRGSSRKSAEQMAAAAAAAKLREESLA
jgi:ribonuclease-3